MENDGYKKDFWLHDLDWTPTQLRIKKARKIEKELTLSGDETELEMLQKKFWPLLKTADSIAKVQPRCPGNEKILKIT